MTPPDRRAKLLETDPAPTLNGIDFVEVAESQKELTIHFLNGVPLAGLPTSARITGGDTIPEVRVLPIQTSDWSTSGSKVRLTLRTAAPGDFSTYTLTLVNDNLDRYFDRVGFSFKANCPSTLDCKTEEDACIDDAAEAPPIDYLAKDFESFKQALLDFSALRAPRWVERSEADLGMVLLEAMASIGDDLSYTQDRVAREAFLDTATERRSLVRHARLVDYQPLPATSARVLLQFQVAGEQVSSVQRLPPGLRVYASSPDGARIDFETGTGLADSAVYLVNAAWNELAPHIWDEGAVCLPAGSTEIWVQGHGLRLSPGLQLLIETEAATPGDPPIRQIVEITGAPEETTDPLVDAADQAVTRITWRKEDKLAKERDLTKTTVRGNIVPATQGRRHVEVFATAVEAAVPSSIARAIVRTGPRSTSASAGSDGGTGAAPDRFLYTLKSAPLSWLAPLTSSSVAGSTDIRPEIRLTRKDGATPRDFDFFGTLLDADGFDDAFTVDPARFALVRAEVPPGSLKQTRYFDYDGDAGDTVRFGDGTFGAMPEDGAVFEVAYRTGNGAAGNVAADAIRGIDPQSLSAGIVSAVNNPLPAWGGADQETAESIRRNAPEAFKAKQLRAVRREDYESAAEELSWVQRAGTTFRYTGSWRTVFTAADVLDTEASTSGASLPAGTPSPTQQLEAVELLNRRRMAGYESYVLDPRFVAIDLQVEVCARRDTFAAQVTAALLKKLSAKRFADGTTGFFHVDRFTFGQPLEKSALTAAIMQVSGVDGVRAIRHRLRGRHSEYVDMPDTILVGEDEIIRVDSNPSRPERGSVRITVEGGK